MTYDWRAARRRRNQDPEYVAKQKAKRKAYRKRREKTPEGWLKAVLRSIRQRAKRRGLECSITWQDLEVPERCPILGTPLVLGQGLGAKDGPSVDRIDPSKGYVVGNVRVISNWANLLRGDCTDPDVFYFLWLDALAIERKAEDTASLAAGPPLAEGGAAVPPRLAPPDQHWRSCV